MIIHSHMVKCISVCVCVSTGCESCPNTNMWINIQSKTLVSKHTVSLYIITVFLILCAAYVLLYLMTVYGLFSQLCRGKKRVSYNRLKTNLTRRLFLQVSSDISPKITNQHNKSQSTISCCYSCFKFSHV